ncbi:MAG: prolipoprotein diacylglyceryl transferase [Deltaproteobacteria bacterium]|nr:prolipoprotein diacylglyceryl transferase [Deltaproteobacteria bacterium]
MSGPLIPFIDGAHHELPIPFLEFLNPKNPPSIKPFGTLVAIGVYVGSLLTLKRARERRLDEKVFNDFIFWVVSSGFVLSHMLDALFYHPTRVKADPIYLFKIWDGLSSYGGFIGAVIGAFAWRYARRRPILEYVDITVSAFPLAWVFGRAGCSVVHDHPGKLSNAWFAVRYPVEQLAAGYEGRIDLGFIEFALTIPLAIACHYLWQRRPLRANGFYVGLTLTAYAPIRFLLDFYRIEPKDAGRIVEADPRYAGLTPAQWACFLALAVGLYFLTKTRSSDYVRTAMAEEGDDEGDEDDDEPADDETADEEPGNEGAGSDTDDAPAADEPKG